MFLDAVLRVGSNCGRAFSTVFSTCSRHKPVLYKGRKILFVIRIIRPAYIMVFAEIPPSPISNYIKLTQYAIQLSVE